MVHGEKIHVPTTLCGFIKSKSIDNYYSKGIPPTVNNFLSKYL